MARFSRIAGNTAVRNPKSRHFHGLERPFQPLFAQNHCSKCCARGDSSCNAGGFKVLRQGVEIRQKRAGFSRIASNPAFTDQQTGFARPATAIYARFRVAANRVNAFFQEAKTQPNSNPLTPLSLLQVTGPPDMVASIFRGALRRSLDGQTKATALAAKRFPGQIFFHCIAV